MFWYWWFQFRLGAALRIAPMLVLLGFLAIWNGWYARKVDFVRVGPDPVQYQASLPPMPATGTSDPAAVRKADAMTYHTGPLNLDSGILSPPADLRWISALDAAFATRQLGQPSGQTLKAMLVPKGTNLTGTAEDATLWGMTVASMPGFVDDSEYASIDAAAVLQSLIANNQAANHGNGYAITLVGWEQAPHFDASRHALTWAKRYRIGGRTVTTFSLRLFTRAETVEVDSVGAPQALAMYQQMAKEFLAAYQVSPDQNAAASQTGDMVNFLQPAQIFTTAAENGPVTMHPAFSATAIIIFLVLGGAAGWWMVKGYAMVVESSKPPPVEPARRGAEVSRSTCPRCRQPVALVANCPACGFPIGR